MYIFTSVTSNYIPKARVLAQSCKEHNPGYTFVLILSDAIPQWVTPGHEPFDHIVCAHDMGIPGFKPWAFQHSVVELCTAVKGRAFQYIREHFMAEKIVYLDPDIAVFDSLDPLSNMLEQHDILLTPHQVDPEEDERAIVDNEICSLKHGVFNLGFLAVAMRGDGKRFVDWWADRLHKFCHDDIPNGLFTDQRWADLAPCFFPGLHVLREPNSNVATWNINRRTFGGDLKSGIMVNGEPLRFYHFSGYDSGAYTIMLDLYGAGKPQLQELKAWYASALHQAGQEEYGKTPSIYTAFDNNESISKYHRLIYRTRSDVRAYFPNPYATENVDASYYHWFKANMGEQELLASPAVRDQEFFQLKSELFAIKNSRTWKILCELKKIYHLFRR